MALDVGLLGGTFDPPHLGHLVVAECARVELGLDEVRLLVAGEPWMKGADATPAAQRLALVRAAVADDPHLDVDARELDRPGPTYTVDTLSQLRAEQPEVRLTFLLGADAAARLASWHRVEQALALARFVVVTRPGSRGPAPDGPVGPLPELEVPALAISSRELRRRYAAGLATRYLVPAAVDALIRARGLYGAGPER